MKDPTRKPARNRTRTAQLERDLARAVNRLLAEFDSETGHTPHAVDFELMREENSAGDGGRYVVASARTHFDD